MNTPNPLVPQGSLERHSKGKSTVRIAIFTIVSIHAVFFAGLLMQGCRRDEVKTPVKLTELTTNQNTLPPIDPGYYTATQELAQPSPTPAPAASLPAVVTEAPPSLPPVTPAELPSEGKTYTIVKGDTLTKIARANGITIGALTKANPNLDPARLRPGQKIQVPSGPSSSAALGFKEPGNSTSSSGSSKIHLVKAGETLTRIARQHGTTARAIRAANGLKTDRLLVGQKLKLPAGRGASASSESAKAAAAKMTATNPAQVSPLGESGTTLR